MNVLFSRGVGALGVGVVLLGCAGLPGLSTDVQGSVVRVSTYSSTGTGFFVSAPDGRRLVATAFHVVESGEPILIERWVEVAGDKHYVEAWPQTRLVAFDADADLALIELPNVPADRMPALKLGSAEKDEPIYSWGFPDSSLVATLDLTRKEGTVSNLVQLPVYDRRTGKVLKENAIQGLIVSTALEPGFSGGPTTDHAGRVVGVNLLKDLDHQDQNGAVNVAELSELLASIPAPTAPTEQDIQKLLTELQQTILTTPLEKRSDLPEFRYLPLSELPLVRDLLTGLVQLAATHDSKEASAVGMRLAMLPGRTWETWSSTEVQGTIANCQARVDQLTQLLGMPDPGASVACGDLGLRPVAWDLLASTLHWEGAVRTLTVGGVQVVDAARGIYKADLHYEGAAITVPIYVTTEGGRLSLKVFDPDQRLSAAGTGSALATRELAGSWHRTRTYRFADYDLVATEELIINEERAGTVSIIHRIQEIGESQNGQPWRCNGSTTYNSRITQYFGGALSTGAVISEPLQAADTRGDQRCAGESYTPDTLAGFKRVGDVIVMARTAGDGWPEQVEFIAGAAQIPEDPPATDAPAAGSPSGSSAVDSRPPRVAPNRPSRPSGGPPGRPRR